MLLPVGVGSRASSQRLASGSPRVVHTGPRATPERQRGKPHQRPVPLTTHPPAERTTKDVPPAECDGSGGRPRSTPAPLPPRPRPCAPGRTPWLHLTMRFPAPPGQPARLSTSYAGGSADYSWFRSLRKQEFVGIVWFLSSSGQKLLVFNGKILLKPIKTAVFYCFLIFSQKSPSTVS